MSGVFGRVAIITSLVDFADEIPDVFGKYPFGSIPGHRSGKVFLPPCAFLKADGAIAETKATALRLARAHQLLGRQMRAEHSPPVVPVRYRVGLPPT
jgi:hypothetical protein